MANIVSWFKAEKGSVHRDVTATIRHIQAQQAFQRFEMASFLEYYSGGNIAGLGRTINIQSKGKYGGNFNLCSSFCDTAVSLVAANNPLPIYVTSGVDIKVLRIAEKRTKVLQSQMNELANRVIQSAYLTAAKIGTGCIHGYIDQETNLPVLEEVNPLEIFVEHADGYYGKPKSMHRLKYIHRQELQEMFPSRSQAIDHANTAISDAISRMFMSQSHQKTDMLEVIESWHLPSLKQKGRHTIVCSSLDLLDESFSDSDFPFTFVRYRKRSFGFWGSSLIEAIKPTQDRINDLIRKVARGQDLASNIIVFNPNGPGSIDPQTITNEMGLIFNYDQVTGTPNLVKWDGTLQDLQQQIDLEEGRALRQEGLSPSQMAGEGPGPGLSSAVAVRAKDSVMSRRLVQQIKGFTDFSQDTARLIARLNDELADENPDYEARGTYVDGGLTFLRTSTWADLALDEGQALLNMMPMSMVPTTPEGKFAACYEWLESGFIDHRFARKMLEFPALDEYSTLHDAPIDLIRLQLEKMLDGEQILPYERQPLDMCVELGTLMWSQVMMKNETPEREEVLDAVEAYIDYAQELMKKAAPPPVPEAMAQPGAAPMPPEAVPPMAAA